MVTLELHVKLNSLKMCFKFEKIVFKTFRTQFPGFWHEIPSRLAQASKYVYILLGLLNEYLVTLEANVKLNSLKIVSKFKKKSKGMPKNPIFCSGDNSHLLVLGKG